MISKFTFATKKLSSVLQMLLVENHDLVHDYITKVVAGKFSVQHDDIEAGGEGNEAVAVRSM